MSAYRKRVTLAFGLVRYHKKHAHKTLYKIADGRGKDTIERMLHFGMSSACIIKNFLTFM